MDTQKIGKIIKKKRKELGITQQELAEKLFLTSKTISRWETGMYMPDMSLLIPLSNILNLSVYELLSGDENPKKNNNIETEIRFLYSLSEEDKILNYLKKIKELNYKGKFNEVTYQYNHPMKEYNYYSKEIDARFRVRKTTNENTKKCMITYKRRNENFLTEKINTEEEVEVSIDYDEFNNMKYLLENVIHMELVESYERTRHIFCNEDIEVAIDIYPFMIAIEIENKSIDKDPKTVILYYLNLLGFDIDESYRLSWDDKYEELCKNQNIEIYKFVDNTKEMPVFLNHLFNKN